jgi:hypothetical protein
MANVGEEERCVEGFCGKRGSNTPLGISRLRWEYDMECGAVLEQPKLYWVCRESASWS